MPESVSSLPSLLKLTAQELVGSFQLTIPDLFFNLKPEGLESGYLTKGTGLKILVSLYSGTKVLS